MSEKAFEKKWNERFSQSKRVKREPASFLRWTIDYFESATVLDLACGEGRNSFYLKQRDCKLICVDGSSEALKLLQSVYDIEGHLLDLEDGDNSVNQLQKLEPFDRVLISFYRPSIQVWDYLASDKCPAKQIIFANFSEFQPNFSTKFCFDESLLTVLKKRFRVILHREGESPEGRVRLCVLAKEES